jgi:hypothetical protein
MELQEEKNNKRFLGLLVIALIILGGIFAVHLMSPEATFLRFKSSASPDIASYKMYVEEYGKVVTYDSPSYDLGKTPVVNLSVLLGNGTYTIGMVGVDSKGNQSSMTIVENKININFY